MNLKMMRKYVATAGVVALCSAALCTVPVMAQGGGGGFRMTSDQRVANIDKAVGPLSEDQKTKIKAIYDADMKKMMDERQSGDDRDTMMQKMQAMRADENAKIKALLTDDQKTKYDAYLASMPQRRPGGGGNGGGGTPPPPPPQQ